MKPPPLGHPERADEGLGVVDRLELSRPEHARFGSCVPMLVPGRRERLHVHAPRARPEALRPGAEGHGRFRQNRGIHVDQRSATEHEPRRKTAVHDMP